MKTFLIVFVAGLALGLSAFAGGVTKIDDGGAELVLEDLQTDDEPAVVLIYTPWDQAGQNLVGDLENWSGQNQDLFVFLVACDGPMTSVARQFSLDRLPAILVFDKDAEQVGDSVDTTRDLDSLLRDHRLLK